MPNSPTSPWPALSAGGRQRWATRLEALNPRVARLVGRPPLLLKDVPMRAHVGGELGFQWLEVDQTWLYHRAHMQGTDLRAMRAVAAYVLGTLYVRAAGIPLPDPFVGTVLRELGLPLAPARGFAASLNPLDPLQSDVPADVRVLGLTVGYG